MKRLNATLLSTSAAAYVVGGLSVFLKIQVLGHDSVVWWRGAMGLLLFTIALSLSGWQSTEQTRR